MTMSTRSRIRSFPSRPSKKQGSLPRMPTMSDTLNEENTDKLPENLTSSMDLLSSVDPSYSPPKENLFVDTTTASSPTAFDGTKESSFAFDEGEPFSISSLPSNKRRRGTPQGSKENAATALFTQENEGIEDDEASKQAKFDEEVVEEEQDDGDEEQWINILQLSPSKRTQRYWEICYGDTSKPIDKSFSANRAPPSKGCLSSKKRPRSNALEAMAIAATAVADEKSKCLLTPTPQVTQEHHFSTPQASPNDDFMMLQEDSKADTDIYNTRPCMVQFGPCTAVEYDSNQPSQKFTPIPADRAAERFPNEARALDDNTKELIAETKKNSAVLAKWEDIEDETEDDEITFQLKRPPRRKRRSSGFFSPKEGSTCLLDDNEMDALHTLSSLSVRSPPGSMEHEQQLFEKEAENSSDDQSPDDVQREVFQTLNMHERCLLNPSNLNHLEGPMQMSCLLKLLSACDPSLFLDNLEERQEDDSTPSSWADFFESNQSLKSIFEESLRTLNLYTGLVPDTTPENQEQALLRLSKDPFFDGVYDKLKLVAEQDLLEKETDILETLALRIQVLAEKVRSAHKSLDSIAKTASSKRFTKQLIACETETVKQLEANLEAALHRNEGLVHSKLQQELLLTPLAALTAKATVGLAPFQLETLKNKTRAVFPTVIQGIQVCIVSNKSHYPSVEQVYVDVDVMSNKDTPIPQHHVVAEFHRALFSAKLGFDLAYLKSLEVPECAQHLALFLSRLRLACLDFLSVAESYKTVDLSLEGQQVIVTIELPRQTTLQAVYDTKKPACLACCFPTNLVVRKGGDIVQGFSSDFSGASYLQSLCESLLSKLAKDAQHNE